MTGVFQELIDVKEELARARRQIELMSRGEEAIVDDVRRAMAAEMRINPGEQHPYVTGDLRHRIADWIALWRLGPAVKS